MVKIFGFWGISKSDPFSWNPPVQRGFSAKTLAHLGMLDMLCRLVVSLTGVSCSYAGVRAESSAWALRINIGVCIY